MTLKFERWYPVLLGAIAAAVYWFVFRSDPLPSAAQNLFLAVISIGAIAVGFLATAKSILISIESKPIIEQLKNVGYYNLLVDYLMNAVMWSFFLSITSTICLLLDWDNVAMGHRVALAIWLFVLTTTLASCYRVIHIFGKILRSRQ